MNKRGETEYSGVGGSVPRPPQGNHRGGEHLSVHPRRTAKLQRL